MLKKIILILFTKVLIVFFWRRIQYFLQFFYQKKIKIITELSKFNVLNAQFF